MSRKGHIPTFSEAIFTLLNDTIHIDISLLDLKVLPEHSWNVALMVAWLRRIKSVIITASPKYRSLGGMEYPIELCGTPAY